MEARIHRGATEIGGSCVELRHDGRTLLLDLGRPLTADRADVVPLPSVVGCGEPGPPPVGVVISHGHQDHDGLVPQLPAGIPVWWSEGTAAVLDAAAFWTGGSTCRPGPRYRTGEAFDVGPFAVTPLLADHSAYDAHSLLVEAGGRRLLYTGDLRSHGRKPGAFRRLLDDPPAPVHAMLMEGTNLRADAADTSLLEGGALSESAVEEQLAETLRTATGLVVVLTSSQNVDRLVTSYRAALRAGRSTGVDLYTADVAAATGRATIPRPATAWPRVRAYLPLRQRVAVKRSGEFTRTAAVREHRVFDEHLAADPGGWVLAGAHQSEVSALLRKGLLEGGAVVWSMWDGYLTQPRLQRMQEELAAAGVPLVHHHTSGHAVPADLRRLVDAVRPEALVPIHTDAPERYAAEFGPATTLRPDGEWWAV